MSGKEVIAKEEYAEKLRAALDARNSREFVVVARTDARASEGLDMAIKRGLLYKEIGADAIFIEAPKSVGEMRKIGKAIKAPLVANMIEGGATPLLSSKELHRMGFNLILYPLSVLYANAFATLHILKELKKTGTTFRLRKNLVSFDQFNEIVDLARFKKMENKYAAKS